MAFKDVFYRQRHGYRNLFPKSKGTLRENKGTQLPEAEKEGLKLPNIKPLTTYSDYTKSMDFTPRREVRKLPLITPDFIIASDWPSERLHSKLWRQYIK
ncbi:DgyrCDS14000 [Dimorphilus gyrociliatus]|uniref:DgyrCDS14000 n=1 Tax=Dimorphilus gyrociliatus TaxID=2664684 RepID=A0A7I8WC81_9ANNE|nr:DgyrCDS14000 [Dimorphilus gyrociliatus]